MQGEASERQCGAPDTLSSKGEVQTPTLGQITWPFLPVPKAGWGLTRFSSFLGQGGQELCPGACDTGRA